jgi:hypothetical protein
MKSFLTFLKWTKINVQKWVAEKVLTEKKICLGSEKLWCQNTPKKNILLL